MDQALLRHILTIWPWLGPVLEWSGWISAHRYYVLGGLFVTTVAASMLYHRFVDRRTPASETHGTARLMTEAEVLASPKFRGAGVPVGRVRGQTLRVGQEENVLVVGPRGVGKSTRIVIPAADIAESQIIIDSSGELLDTMYATRKARGPVYVLDFTNPMGDHYNLFEGVRWTPWDEVQDVQRVIENLMYQDPRTVKTDAGTFYRPWTFLLHVGSVLHLGHTKDFRLSLGTLLHHYQSGEGSFMRVLMEMEASAHPKVRQVATSIRQNKPDIIKNIWASAILSLFPFLDDKLAAVTDDTTIPIPSLQSERYPSTVIVRVSPQDARGRLNGVVRAVLDQLSLRLTDRHPTDYHQEVRWIVDDAAIFGHLEVLRDTPAHLRKYGHRTLYALQSFGQLFDAFGAHAGGILTNSTVWVMFRPMERSEADLMSRRLDDMTVTEIVERVTASGWAPAARTVGEQSSGRALLTPDEIMRLGGAEEGWTLVCAQGQRPALLRHPAWYEAVE